MGGCLTCLDDVDVSSALELSQDQIQYQIGSLFCPDKSDQKKTNFLRWALNLKHQDCTFRQAIQNTDFQLLKKKTLDAGGVPSQLRKFIWPKLAQLQNGFQQRFAQGKDITPQQNSLNAISKDLPRTLTTHNFFKEGKGQSLLKQILFALVYNVSDVGYVQGLNVIAGTVLLVTGGDSVLSYGLTQRLLISPKHNLRKYFTQLLSNPMKLSKQFNQTLRKQDKQLADLFQTNFQILLSYLLQIHLTLFMYCFVLQDAIRLWDHFLIKGQDFPKNILSRILCKGKQEFQGFQNNSEILISFFTSLRQRSLINEINLTRLLETV